MSYLITDETRLHTAPGGDRYRIQFLQSDFDGGPWTDNDGATPMVAYGGRDGMHTEPAKGHDLLNPLAFLTDSQIKRNLAALVEVMPARIWNGPTLYTDAATFDSFVRNEYPDLTLREARREWLAEYLGDGEESQSRLEVIATLWGFANVPAVVKETRGYSQGDWAAMLIVAHPDAVREWGFTSTRKGREFIDWARYKRTCPDDLETAARNYGAWRWGGVVGYSVEWINPTEYESELLDIEGTPSPSELNALQDCEPVDSCWGFYPDHDSDYFPLERNHAYAISQAIESADSDGAERAARRADSFVVEMLEARPDLAPSYA